MMITLGCMRMFLTQILILGVLGLTGFGATLSVPSAVFAADTEATAITAKDPVSNTTYDETQPGADDPRVKEGYAAYKAGDFTKAYDIWLPLAEAGNAEAQFRIGRLYDFGEGISVDREKSADWYAAAISQDHLSAIFNMAHTLYWGESDRAEKGYAVTLFFRGAKMGDTKAQHHLGIALAAGDGISRNYVEAFKWLYISLENGNQSVKSTIEKLESITSPEIKTLGHHQMREWFKVHPRTK